MNEKADRLEQVILILIFFEIYDTIINSFKHCKIIIL